MISKSNKLSSFDICLRFKVRGTVFQAQLQSTIIVKLISNVAMVSIENATGLSTDFYCNEKILDLVYSILWMRRTPSVPEICPGRRSIPSPSDGNVLLEYIFSSLSDYPVGVVQFYGEKKTHAARFVIYHGD